MADPNHTGEEPMKIELMEGKCVGHARCAAVAPEVYELDDNGYLTPGLKDVPAGQEAAASRGARACPERAILVHNDGQV
jgi:ferredoxin